MINQIYDDNVHKITFDIPLSMWKAILEKTNRGTRFNGNKSSYLRELIYRDIMGDKLPSSKEFKEIIKDAKIYTVDPPRRYEGFLGGLARNSWVKNWFKQKNNDYKINLDKQYTQN